MQDVILNFFTNSSYLYVLYGLVLLSIGLVFLATFFYFKNNIKGHRAVTNVLIITIILIAFMQTVRKAFLIFLDGNTTFSVVLFTTGLWLLLTPLLIYTRILYIGIQRIQLDKKAFSETLKRHLHRTASIIQHIIIPLFNRYIIHATILALIISIIIIYRTTFLYFFLTVQPIWFILWFLYVNLHRIEDFYEDSRRSEEAIWDKYNRNDFNINLMKRLFVLPPVDEGLPPEIKQSSTTTSHSQTKPQPITSTFAWRTAARSYWAQLHPTTRMFLSSHNTHLAVGLGALSIGYSMYTSIQATAELQVLGKKLETATANAAAANENAIAARNALEKMSKDLSDIKSLIEKGSK